MYLSKLGKRVKQSVPVLVRYCRIESLKESYKPSVAKTYWGVKKVKAFFFGSKCGTKDAAEVCEVCVEQKKKP